MKVKIWLSHHKVDKNKSQWSSFGAYVSAPQSAASDAVVELWSLAWALKDYRFEILKFLKLNYILNSVLKQNIKKNLKGCDIGQGLN